MSDKENNEKIIEVNHCYDESLSYKFKLEKNITFYHSEEKRVLWGKKLFFQMMKKTKMKIS